MTVAITLTVPAEAFVFEQMVADQTELTVRIERIIPLGETLCPFVWVAGGDPTAIERSLRADPHVRAVTQLSTDAGETLYRIEWDEAFDGLLRSIVESDGTLLSAVCTDGRWELSLRFDEHSRASAFQQRATEHDVPIRIAAIHNPAGREREHGRLALTDIQRESLLAAYERGYFDVPRGTTLSALAEGLGVSDTALSQRLRRGIKRLVGETLTGPESAD